MSSFYEAELTAMLVNSQLLREPASSAITMSVLYCKFLVFMNWCMISSRGEGTPNQHPSVIYSARISLEAPRPHRSKMCAGHFSAKPNFQVRFHAIEPFSCDVTVKTLFGVPTNL